MANDEARDVKSSSRSRSHHKKSSKKEKRSKSRDNKHSKRRKHHHKSKKSHHDDRESRQRSSSRYKSSSRRHESSICQIDKEKLLEIAQNNLNRILTNSIDQQEKQGTRDDSVVPIVQGKHSNSIADFIKLCTKLSKHDVNAEELEESKESNNKRFKHAFECREIASSNLSQSIVNQVGSTFSRVQTEKINSSEDKCKIFPVSSGEKHREIETIETSILANGSADMVNQKLEANVNQPKEAMNILIFESDEIPGKFKRDTSGIKLLTPDQLEGNHKAWVRKDYLIKTEPISSGIGVRLMEKMGWKSGEGLGKHKEGTLEPIKVEVKVDRKGLADPNSSKTRIRQPETFSDKNPISMLGEYCAARKWSQPLYEMTHESGPAHLRNFQMKVIVNRVEYLDNQLASTKKQAKTNAAISCLKQMGLIPGSQ